ncbi:MAG: glycogen synthase [Thermotogota bacterium]|nr:glycogen synthase [Thermotogota bacterium]
MKIVLASYEFFPLAKVGGLADVAGALPKYLAKNDVDVEVVMPFHKIIKNKIVNSVFIKKIQTRFLEEDFTFSIYRTNLPETDIPVFLFQNDKLIDSEDIYGGSDLAKQALAFCDVASSFVVERNVHIAHVNDWQTAVIPAYITEMNNDIKTLLTIHNLGYQGNFSKEYFTLSGLPERLWDESISKNGSNFNILKTGILTSDYVSTVSAQYAREIQTKEFGMGLHETLETVSDRLVGIMNGIDYEEYDPKTDMRIPFNFDISNTTGKSKCKNMLLKSLELPDEGKPLIGMITRLYDQKGLDLLSEIADELMNLDAQLVILGTGDKKYEDLFKKIAKKAPDKISAKIMFDVNLAQLIYAGADMFLMPSKYEPCGLGQMFAMRYGTVPVVRYTGGLKDSVTEFDPARGTGNGFGFESYTADDLLETLNKALDCYNDDKLWRKIVKNAMETDFSWERSAKEYEELYRRIIKFGRNTDNA